VHPLAKGIGPTYRRRIDKLGLDVLHGGQVCTLCRIVGVDPPQAIGCIGDMMIGAFVVILETDQIDGAEVLGYLEMIAGLGDLPVGSAVDQGQVYALELLAIAVVNVAGMGLEGVGSILVDVALTRVGALVD